MLRNKQLSKKEIVRCPAPDAAFPGRPPPVPALLDFLDNFDLASFLSDPMYRKQLNDMLDTFSDEEFDLFESRYSHRFTLN